MKDLKDLRGSEKGKPSRSSQIDLVKRIEQLEEALTRVVLIIEALAIKTGVQKKEWLKPQLEKKEPNGLIV